jgi:GT2 family glycosyltransferase
MSEQTDLSIIIINFKSVEFTKECLRTIFESAGSQRKPEVIVVDNASFDGCEEMIRDTYPQVRFIQCGHNLGFGGANNLGLSLAHGSCILFLNPDTEVQAGALERLVGSLASLPSAGLIGARLLNSDYSVQTTSITALPSILNQVLGTEYLRQKFPNSRLWGMKPLFERHTNPVEVDAISGACMLGRREVIEAVGGFTSDYFMYAEDLDLCVKVKKAGWKVYYDPTAVIVHHGGRSSDSRPERNYAQIMIRESLFRFMQVHRGTAYAWLFRAATTAVAACRVALLTLLLPLTLLPTYSTAVPRIWRRWVAICGWGLGLLDWAPHRQPNPQPIPAGSSQAR